LLLWFESNDPHRHRRVTFLLMAFGQLLKGIAQSRDPFRIDGGASRRKSKDTPRVL
jgi:hypothetical protein